MVVAQKCTRRGGGVWKNALPKVVSYNVNNYVMGGDYKCAFANANFTRLADFSRLLTARYVCANPHDCPLINRVSDKEAPS